MRILIVDDEPAIIRALQPVLDAVGHQTSVACDGRTTLEAINARDFDLVLLDLGLPDVDGSELIASIRAKAEANIIVVSARHLEADKVRALDEGADDYVDKPFSLDELLARIRVVERRRMAGSGGYEELVSDILTVNTGRREVTLMGEPIHLSPKEYDLFEVLARRSGQVVTHRRLMIAGWDDPSVDSQYLRSYIALLRDKLEADPSDPDLILTEAGVGYRLNVNLFPAR